ncbi:MAG: hypothetical protein MUC54_03845 [Chloroflexi bacterium]|jgi:hypothetical protein|nr:hypothetical protein [Chloroflexota bacterium]
MSAICDVCNQPTSELVGTAYSASEFRDLVARGFEPGPEMFLHATAFGIDRQTALAGWKHDLVARSTTGWLLCPACAARAGRLTPRGAAAPSPAPVPEPRSVAAPAAAASTAADVSPPVAAAPSTAAVADGGRVPCPRCAELILPAALVCRFCGLDLATSSAVTGVAPAAATRAVPASGATTYGLRVPGTGRVAGPARLTVSPARLELDAGWVDLAADRTTRIVTAIVLAGLVIAAVPIVLAAADGRFHPERVAGLSQALVIVPATALIGLALLRRWRDRRRLRQLTSCPPLAAEAGTAVDAGTAALVGVLGLLLGGAAWLLHQEVEIQLAIAIGGCVVALGAYLAATGRPVVTIRAPLDPQRRGSTVITLRARNRDAATDIVAAIRDAQRQAGSMEVHAR